MTRIAGTSLFQDRDKFFDDRNAGDKLILLNKIKTNIGDNIYPH